MSNPVTLEIGNHAPSFTCKDSAGNEHDLATYGAEGKTVILYFYPRDLNTLDARTKLVTFETTWVV